MHTGLATLFPPSRTALCFSHRGGQTWANDTMINQTVCHVGCLMSSVSMALRKNGILIDGKPATPGTLNAWLRVNGVRDLRVYMCVCVLCTLNR